MDKYGYRGDIALTTTLATMMAPRWVVPCKLLPPSSMTLVIPTPGSNVARRYAADPAQR